MTLEVVKLIKEKGMLDYHDFEIINILRDLNTKVC